MARTQEERDEYIAVFGEDPDDGYEDDYEDDNGDDGTPIVIMVPSMTTPKPTPKPASTPVPEPTPLVSAPKPQPDRFSALAEAIVSVKAALPPAALIPVIQGILDATGDPFADDAATRLAAETPTSVLLEELLAIESLLDKAIEGYPALVAFFTPQRRALLFGKK